MKRTRATRGCITRTIFSTLVTVTIYNKDKRAIEEVERTLRSTKTLSDTEIEKQIDKVLNLDDGGKILDIRVKNVDEEMYAMSIESFIMHGEKVEVEAEQED